MASGCPPLCPRGHNSALPPFCTTSDCYVFESTMDGMRKIARREGLSTLWRGTNASLLMAVPMVGIYFPLYDYLNVALAPTAGKPPPVAMPVPMSTAVPSAFS